MPNGYHLGDCQETSLGKSVTYTAKWGCKSQIFFSFRHEWLLQTFLGPGHDWLPHIPFS